MEFHGGESPDCELYHADSLPDHYGQERQLQYTRQIFSLRSLSPVTASVSRLPPCVLPAGKPPEGKEGDPDEEVPGEFLGISSPCSQRNIGRYLEKNDDQHKADASHERKAKVFSIRVRSFFFIQMLRSDGEKSGSGRVAAPPGVHYFTLTWLRLCAWPSFFLEMAHTGFVASIKGRVHVVF